MRRAVALASLAFAAAGTGACGGGLTETLERTAQIQFRSADGATVNGNAPIEAMVVEQGVVVDEALLADIAGRAALRTWPEDMLVGFTVEHQLNAGPGLHVVRIVPAAGLEDRWYLATFDSLPAHVYVTPLGGEGGVRVRLGPHPAVMR